MNIKVPDAPLFSGSLIVSFDFDSTLSRKDVQEYAKELLERGIDVWVVTSRYDELHKHRYPHNPTNNDLWLVIDELNIPRWKVRFTCMESKFLYLMHTKTVWHLDDDTFELYEMRSNKCQTVGISVNSGNWKQKCERYLQRSVKGSVKQPLIRLKALSENSIADLICRERDAKKAEIILSIKKLFQEK
jgi:hypothetical protein